MKVILGGRAEQSIISFYENVLNKYRNTYTEEDMYNSIEYVCQAILKFTDDGKEPMLQKYRTKGYKELFLKKNKENKKEWYFEYKIEVDPRNNETVLHIYEAIHHSNMYEFISESLSYDKKKQLYESIMRDIAKIVKKALKDYDN